MRPLKVSIATTLLGVSVAAALLGVLLATTAAKTASLNSEVRLADLGREPGKPSGLDKLREADKGEQCAVARLAGPLELASRISAFEAFIGIRTSQLDAWRNYTDALQAMPVGPESERRGDTEATLAAPDLLAQSAALALDATAANDRATRLLASVEALGAALTEEQKARLSEAGPLFPTKCPGTLATAEPHPADDKARQPREAR